MHATVKETIVAALQRAGYDTVTACEHAQRKIQELKASPAGRYRITAGDKIITVDKT